MKQAKVSQSNSDSTVDLSLYGSLSNLYQCPQCEKKSLAQMGTKFDCIWCDFSKDIAKKSSSANPSNHAETNFWFLLISTIVIVLLFHSNG